MISILCEIENVDQERERNTGTSLAERDEHGNGENDGVLHLGGSGNF